MGPDRKDQRKPLVAIICHGATQCERRSQFTTDSFIRAVVNAGGSTILVPAIRDAVDIHAIARSCDALLLTGSRSMVSPCRYGSDREEPDCNPDRDAVSFDMSERMIALRKPILGICLGMQELNVLYGGSLRYLDDHGIHMRNAEWQDITIFDHAHEVEITCERLAKSGGSRQTIISAHRQGIDRLGQGLEIAAVAEDGLVEAIRADKEGRIMGVQWHPERLRAPIDHALFRNMIELA